MLVLPIFFFHILHNIYPCIEYLSSEKKEAKQKRKNLKDKENARKNMEAEIVSMDEQLKPI